MSASETTQEEVTMVDVLEQQAAFEEDAHAVLGGSDDRECTFKRGYVKRQALYACLSCSKGARAGVCLACSLSCHDRHELVELYTKRNFRCDCGGPSFPGAPCGFNGARDEPNARNRYDHNFSGLYCNCARPYPDPDANDTADDDMIQCVVCEDWLHARHLGADPPSHDDYAEMTCEACVRANPFLKDYVGAALNATLDTTADTTLNTTVDTAINTAEEKEETKNEKIEGNKRKLEEEMGENPAKKQKGESPCVRPASEAYAKGALFWPSDWRGRLCPCPVCSDMYRSLGVSFLLDAEDTVTHYENLGKMKTASSSSQYERGLEALSSLDRVQQINALTEYNKMKEKLLEFLKTFKDKKEVVREEDIRDFFAGMKPKREPDGVYFCR